MTRLVLALLALFAGAFAAVAGLPKPALRPYEITAIALAAAIRDRQPGLLIVDVRDAEAFKRDRLPGARPVADISPRELADITTIVAYGARQLDDDALDNLRERSHFQSILRLQGGAQAWNEEVLFPMLRSDASAMQQQEFVRRAELSRYFGGTPRMLDPGEVRGAQKSRRGC